MRLFVALDLEPGITARLHQALQSWRRIAPQARWTQVESMHLTLKFIGEVPPPMEERIIAALGGIRLPAFPIEMTGVGTFPGPQRARVFWAGIQPSTALALLARSVEEQLLPLGIAADQRPFSPHLTLARGRTPTELKPLLSLLEEAPPLWGRQFAETFYLYQSHPARGTYQYEKRHAFPLLSPKDESLPEQ